MAFVDCVARAMKKIKITSKVGGIFLANLFFVSFILMTLLAIWWKRMYSVGMSVDFWRVIPVLILTAIILTILLTWVTVRLSKPKD